MFHAFDPGAEIPSAELTSPDRALAALTLRCAQIEYTGSNGYVHQRDVYWVPLAVRPRDGSSWLLWEKVPPCYPNSLRELPATGLESARVLVDGDVYLADRRNYLTTSYDRLQPGAWMAN